MMYYNQMGRYEFNSFSTDVLDVNTVTEDLVLDYYKNTGRNTTMDCCIIGVFFLESLEHVVQCAKFMYMPIIAENIHMLYDKPTYIKRLINERGGELYKLLHNNEVLKPYFDAGLRYEYRNFNG